MASKDKTFLQIYQAAIKPHNDGSLGQYRGPDEFNISGANTDKEAIAAFLAQYKNSPTTLRAYIKETERFHMWVVLKLNKSIPDMTVDDYQSYLDFLANPDEAWVTRKRVSKSSEDWRPFTTIIRNEGLSKVALGLSTGAVVLAFASLSSMLTWMVDAGYLRINPLKILRQKNQIIGQNTWTSSKKVERVLDQDMVKAAKNSVEAFPKLTINQINHYERARFLLTMFIMIGARVSELSNAKMQDIAKEISGWFWSVIGKGSKEEKVPVPQDMIDGLMRWREALKLPSLPDQSELIAVIPAFNKMGEPVFFTKKKKKVNGKTVTYEVVRHGLSPRRINEVLKEIFIQASHDPSLTKDKKIMLRKASAHWLRHTAVTQKIESGMDRSMVQKDARHSDMKTTDRYDHTEAKARNHEAQKHKFKW